MTLETKNALNFPPTPKE